MSELRTAFRPATEPMLQTVPPPRWSMWGTARRTSSNGAETLKWKDFSSWDTEVSRNGLDIEPPALFTTMSMAPKWSIVRFTIEASESMSLTSPVSGRARPPAATTSEATCSRSASVRAVSTQSAPTSAKAFAIAAPMPLPAPVMIATFLSRRNRSGAVLGIVGSCGCADVRRFGTPERRPISVRNRTRGGWSLGVHPGSSAQSQRNRRG